MAGTPAAQRAHWFDYNELADISNVKADGEVANRVHAKIFCNVAHQLWHSDSSFQKPRQVLHAVATHDALHSRFTLGTPTTPRSGMARMNK